MSGRQPFLFAGCALLLMSISWSGLSLTGALFGVGALIAGTALIVAHFATLGRRLYLLATLVPSMAFFSARAFFGRYDLHNVPQDLEVFLVDYNRAALLASVSILVTAGCYFVASRSFGRRHPASTLSPPAPTIVRRLMWFGCAAAVVEAMLLFGFGIGVKRVKASIPFQGLLVLGAASILSIAAVGLLIVGLTAGNRRGIRNGALLLLADLALGLYGGVRGGIFEVILLVAGVALVVSEGRASARQLGRIVFAGAVLAIPITQLAVARRDDVAGGGSFRLLDFLALRMSGMNRFAPVVANDQSYARQAITDSRRLINVEIYGFAETAQVGVGTPAIGIGFLAAGIAGVVVIAATLGIVAAFGDSRLNRQRSIVWLAFHVVAAKMLLVAVTGWTPTFSIRTFTALLACAFVVDRIVSDSGGRPTHRVHAPPPHAERRG